MSIRTENARMSEPKGDLAMLKKRLCLLAVSGAVYELHEGGLWSIDELLDVAEKRAGTISSPTQSDGCQSNP